MDGLFSGRKRERMLEIMKDSRTGSMGVAAFVCVAAIDWSLLLDMDSRWLVPALFVMPVLGRLMMAAAVTFFPYARPEGMGRAFAAYATPKVFWAELCYALLLVLPGGKLSVLAVLVCMAFTSVLARYAVAKLGGLTGDVYGAIEKLNETVVLLVFLLGSYLL
jgi:adenosylcobinamide-GDP ribazoletransferase